jgi:hypothetical protein
MPEMTAVGVDRTWKFWGTRCSRRSVPNTMPLSDRIHSQARVRITNETKKGRSRRNR